MATNHDWLQDNTSTHVREVYNQDVTAPHTPIAPARGIIAVSVQSIDGLSRSGKDMAVHEVQSIILMLLCLFGSISRTVKSVK
jgi:hypothetical protein